jgi:hypothetical protein
MRMQIDVEQLVEALPTGGIARATRLGLVLTPRLDNDTWRGLVAHVTRLAHSSAGARQTLTAWLGDVLVYGNTQGRGLIAECAAAAGIHPGTLRNAKMVCARIPLSCRHDALSWTHHCEVGLAFVDPHEIERWLGLAEREKLSSAELRRRIRTHLAGISRAGGPVGMAPNSLATFQLLRELRVAGRMLEQQTKLWGRWPPTTAQFALEELRPLVEFVDALRAQTLANGAPPSEYGVN